MAVATSTSGGIVNTSTGSATSAGAAIAVSLGFKPRWVKVINETDGIVWEKLEGMSATKTLKLISHDTAQVVVDTSTAISLDDSGFTLSSTAAGTSKALAWIAGA